MTVLMGREVGEEGMNHSIIQPSPTRFHQWGLHPILRFTHPAPLRFPFLRTRAGWSVSFIAVGFCGQCVCVCDILYNNSRNNDIIAH